jgi:3-oxoacyl-[acyl-carrier protein] reductase
MKLENKTAIITGGAKGMGREISLTLAREGANVVLAARDEAALDGVAREVRGLGRRAEVIGTDVTVPAQVETMVRRAMTVFDGRIDILVCVAGIPGPIETPVWDIDPTAFREVMDVNLLGTFLAIKYVLPAMISRKSGKIITVGSNAGLAAYRNRAGYSASKWALRGLTRTVAVEVGAYNINVNCVCPGAVEGPRMQMLCTEKARLRGCTYDDVHREYEASQALKRTTDAQDTAEAILYLVSEEARNITGQDISVDAGWRL